MTPTYPRQNQYVPPASGVPETTAPMSQTGSPQPPMQVENVQYGVKVGNFSSRMGLAFTVASSSLVVFALATAWTLHGLFVEGGEAEIGGRFVWLISIALPLIPLFIFSNSRINKLMEDPSQREDIIFKKRLRNALWVEIIFASYFIIIGVYGGLSVAVLGKEGNAVESFTSALFYGGAFALLALWSYSFQKKTAR